jgi:hypothetical protein
MTDALWSPDLRPDEDIPAPVVREHYFTVVAEVRADGEVSWYTAEPTDLNLIYLVDKDEWVMVSHTPEIETDDKNLNFELGRRLS